MKHVLHLKYIKWREGRPRFEPGPHMRRYGLKAEDLRHRDTGNWYTVEEAQAFSERVMAQYSDLRRDKLDTMIVGRGRPTIQAAGFIYFLWSGSHIKIGYSTEPTQRLSQLLTGLAEGVRSFALVPGERRDERRLHVALDRHRRKGEWFAATSEVIEAMKLSLACGRAEIAVRPERAEAGKSSVV